MPYSPFNLWELRYVDNGSTFPTSPTAANDAAWDPGTATKLRAYDMELDLNYDSVRDMTLQETMHGHPPNLETIRQGTIKFKMHLEGGTGTTSPGTLATLLSKVMGGVSNCAQATLGLDAASTASALVFDSAHGATWGHALLCGTRGDGRGEGKAGVISEISTTSVTNDTATLYAALPGAPGGSDTAYFGSTVYFDPTATNYLSFLAIGDYAGSGAADDPVLFNLIGCVGSATIGGLAPGETPFVGFEFQVGDWRHEPYSTTDAISRGTSRNGGDPTGPRNLGSLLIGDYSSTTRVTAQGGELEIALNETWLPIEGWNGVNGKEGWARVPSESGPTFSMTSYWADMPGKYNDFTAGTRKSVLIQIGDTATNTVVIDLGSAYLDSNPKLQEFNGLSGIKLDFHGSNHGGTDYNSTSDYVHDSAIRIHFL